MIPYVFFRVCVAGVAARGTPLYTRSVVIYGSIYRAVNLLDLSVTRKKCH